MRMNKAVTDGLVLMPPAFSAGLQNWSRADGTPGSGSYEAQPNAAFVPNDQDFGSCMELQKVEATQRLRCFREIPFRPDMYLRVTVRIKALAGNLPGVRIAAYVARSNGSNIASVPQVGDTVSLTTYGQVRTISAIIGAGNRRGVDMVWGREPAYAHIGLDLTGGTGGVVRIDDIEIEDCTQVFHRDMMDWVDVRDYGALGNGTTDDQAAFEAADAAAGGRTVLVSEGTYRIAGNLTVNSPIRFEGALTAPAASRIIFRRNFNLETYSQAFGSELQGFRRALQALFSLAEHVVFDLSGRRVDLTGPIDVAALTGVAVMEQRRVLKNGLLFAQPGPAWDTDVTTSVATYATGNPTRLTAVANVANIVVGSAVSGTGVGREVYVRSKNVGAGTVELSQPLWGAAGTRTYTFRRHKYMLDFSGFDSLQRFEISGIEMQCNGVASGILLAPEGLACQVADCTINRPRNSGISSHGRGCQGLLIDRNQFLSDEQGLPTQARVSVVLNVNANDAKLRDNRVVRFAHFAILHGTGHMLVGNHFFHGDDETNGVRRAGVVFTRVNTVALVTGNYIDNCFIEMTNEHDATPDFANELSFGALTVTGNIFIATNVAPSFRFLVIGPRGEGHFLNGLSVTGNAFRTFNGDIDRVERVDTTHAVLDETRFRNVVFEANTFHGVNQITASPVAIEHVQNTAADTWVVAAGGFMPFGGRARTVAAVVAEGAITTGANAVSHSFPYVLTEQGSGGQSVHLQWPQALRGRTRVTVRVDEPV
jgi:hypothetical protein